jgi:hypothetical protein
MKKEFIPKSEWGPGQWQSEPDNDTWDDPFTGWKCELKRNMRHGAWCGYVTIPKDAIEKGSFFNPDSIEVHGGITYQQENHKDNTVTIGFDTAHGYDYNPGHAALLKSIGIPDRNRSHEKYRNHAYCWLEVYSMCRQIEERLK